MKLNKKVLFCATKSIHFHSFHLPYFKWFKEKGYEIHTVAEDQRPLHYVDQQFTIPIQRTPFSTKNIKAYTQLKNILDSTHYQIIHCHTPMGGVLGRLAAKVARKKGTKVIYTAHGFHFYKGAPLLNWLFYYPIEVILSNWTDCLITINKEDYQLAIHKKFKAKRIKHVHGVGVDTAYFQPVTYTQKKELRQQYGFNEGDFILFYAAEFNQNKNQQFLIETLNYLKQELPNAKLLLAGEGPLLIQCREQTDILGISNMVQFLGFRSDIKELLQLSNLAVASSLREGLPVNIMEAMACGLPIVATENRGHNELIHNHENGWTISPNEPQLFSEKLLTLYKNKQLHQLFSENTHRIIQRYSINRVKKELADIYLSYMMEENNESQSQYHRAHL